MSDEKPKPFAEVRVARDGRGHDADLLIDGRVLYDTSSAQAEADASLLNAAVEQREAKLYARLMAARNAARGEQEKFEEQDFIMTDAGRRHVLEAFDGIVAAIDESDDIVVPTLADVGAAFAAGQRLGELERLHSGAWGVLRDALMDNDGQLGDLARALCVEAGVLPAPVDQTVFQALASAAEETASRAKHSGGEFSKGLAAAAEMLRDRVKYLPPAKRMSDDELLAELWNRGARIGLDGPFGKQITTIRLPNARSVPPAAGTVLANITAQAINQHENAVEGALRQLRAFDLRVQRVEMRPPLPEGVLAATTLEGDGERLRVETIMRDGRISTTSFRAPARHALTGVE